MSQEPSKGWILHSQAQGRKFGPLTEEELRNYFRAGMVKSVDRLTAPGDFAMRSEAEVATMLGESAPVGPPPPEITEAPTPLPSMAAGVVKDPAAEERAARAMAAMNIDFAALAASSAPPKARAGWVLPVIAVIALVAMLFVGLGMLRRMGSTGTSKTTGTTTQAGAELVDAPGGGPGAGVGTRNAQLPDANAPPAEDGGEAAESPEDADFHARFQRANALQEAGDWNGLVAHAQAWSVAQPGRIEPQHFLGIAYSRLGNHQMAAEALTKVLQQDPTQDGARALLADTYLQAQRWTEAAAIYKQLVAATPTNSRVWNNYGAALNGMGQPAQAAAALETAVRLDPGFKQAWMNLGQTYQELGDGSKAAAAFANAK
jgi:cytochrome c-type biogenesis protein CcmH/NrfG